MSTAEITSSDSPKRRPRPAVAAASAMKMAVVATVFAVMASPSVAQSAAGEIEKARQEFQQALNMGDADMVARMYTERAVVPPPNAEMIEGREAIQNYWRRRSDWHIRWS
jgi:hypothetical protein